MVGIFSKRKPPRMSLLEELQLKYDEYCSITLNNLNLEEGGKLEEALQGWKSLHTSMMFNIDHFDKLVDSKQIEEYGIFQELKKIKDENIKHLTRTQVVLDSTSKRNSGSKIYNLPSNHSQVSSMSVPSLRNGARPSIGLSNNSSRRMLKSLRPGLQSNNSLGEKGQDQASKAANLIWRNASNGKLPTMSSVKSDDSDPFDDFDQDSVSIGENYNWVQINDYKINEPAVSLIDLDSGVSDPFPSTKKESGNSNYNLSNSMENLDLHKDSELKQNKSKLSKSTGNFNSKSQRIVSDHRTSEQTNHKAPYTYAKPKPINVHQMMSAQQQRSRSPATVAKSPTKRPQSKPKTSSTHIKPSKNNISYNYKPMKQPSNNPQTSNKKQNSPPISGRNLKSTENSSPALDEIFDTYKEEDGSDLELNEGSKENKEQDAFIDSLSGVDPIAAKQILNEIVVKGDEVYWDDIVGLEGAKSSLKEAVVYPFLRPDLFRGLREPTRGMLLFGPPGTGKTMLARAVATESKSTFFAINPSTLTSKYLGESEKLVKALFVIARRMAPSIVFIDEIDSILGSRSDSEVDTTRRIKNEFLVQWSNLSSAAAGREKDNGEDPSRVLILGATNLPWAIDDAARRRFVRRQYIPLPEPETRKSQILKLLSHQKHTILDHEHNELMLLTEGFSGSDITALAKDSAMGPLRALGDKLLDTPTEQIRPINISDFKMSLNYIRPSVSSEGLKEYEEWAAKFGSSGA